MSQVNYPTPAQPESKVESKPETKPVSTWRKVLAAILDFITVFALGGYIIASFTGGTTSSGFELNGWPALLLFAIVILYFTVFSRYLGGTLWQRLLGTR